MPTLNQQRVAQKVKEVIEKRQAIDGKDILAFVGYSRGIQKNAGVVFKSKGFQKALKALGFSLEAADLVVAKILQTGREENRLKASDQIYKRLSGYAPEKHQVAVWEISEEEKKIAKKALEDL